MGVSTFALLLFLIGTVISMAGHAADRCDAIFTTQDRVENAAQDALKKISSNKSTSGLSRKDLELIVERLFKKEDGLRYKVSDYYKHNFEQRTLQTLQRQVAEELVKKGLIKFFEEHGYLIDNSKITTKLIAINRSTSVNIASASLGVVGTLKGAPPIFLPEVSFKIKKEDFNLLLLKGINSPEGMEIARKYEIRMELNRGYDIFSRYYYRFALAVFAYITYDKIQDHLKNKNPSEQENNFDQLMDNINNHFEPEPLPQSKEDIIFDLVLRGFKEKYNREPTEEERKHICQRVYGEKVCRP
jgi:hypothetical protein